MGVQSIGQDDFQTAVLESPQPVLVDFFATYCGPCKLLDPIMEELSTSYEGRLKVVKVNIEEATDIAARFGVLNVPVLLLVKDGEEVDRKLGLVPKPALDSWIQKHVA